MDILIEEDDLAFEEDILRHPYSVRSWLRYAENKKKHDSDNKSVNLIYERALQELPGSYKLWYSYLKVRRKQLEKRCVRDALFEDVNNAFERALVYMHKMPRIWIDYCQLLTEQGKVTKTRRTFDRALRALPVTQHRRVWPLYLKFVKSHDIPETALRVFRRHVKLEFENAEEFANYLRDRGMLDECARLMAQCINSECFVSREGKSKHQMWQDLCDMMSKNPDKVTSLKVEPIIRQGIKKYSDQVGLLWNSLADYYIRMGHFEKARNIYEEAVQTVITVRDFTQIFDAYAQFEEGTISMKMDQSSADGLSDTDDVDLELHLARLEYLLERRPLLLNSVLLRQNPHNVHEWHKRVELYDGSPIEIINTYTEAVQTVDPLLASGKLNSLWVAFARFYEKAEQLDDARIIFEKGTMVPFKNVEDLAAVWCEWAEMEIRHEQYQAAMKLLQRATAPPPRKVAYFDASETVQMRVHKSLRVWSLYADLEESFGTFKSCKAVYDRILDLRIATPQIVMNYGMFLQESNYFEEAFKAYENGIALFKWPNVYDIWNTYLIKFMERYGGKKLERARDLFEQCLENCPPKFAKSLYLLYAKLEEEHGLARHAMAIYDRAINAVLPSDRVEMYTIYIKQAAGIYGLTHTRAIYEKAIEVLPDDAARDMCMRFADLERKLGEIDRARAIYCHCAQLCDPRSTKLFWEAWKEFEIKHGNEDTVREMLRIKRSMQAIYNTQVNFMSSQMIATQQNSEQEPANEMQKLERKALEMAAESVNDRLKIAAVAEKGVKFVRSSNIEDEVKRDGATANPDEIDLGDDDDGAAEGDGTVDGGGKRLHSPDVDVEQQAVPSEVYGGLKTDDEK